MRRDRATKSKFDIQSADGLSGAVTFLQERFHLLTMDEVEQASDSSVSDINAVHDRAADQIAQIEKERDATIMGIADADGSRILQQIGYRLTLNDAYVSIINEAKPFSGSPEYSKLVSASEDNREVYAQLGEFYRKLYK